jgi:hypothetical protein
MNRIRFLATLLCLAAPLSSGCLGKIQQAAERARRANDLRQLAILYHNFHDAKNRGPASADELMTLAADPQEKSVVQAAKDGQYVVIWGVNIGEVARGGAGMSQTVLAYEKDVPTSGGMVATVDGNVTNMTAAEFQAAPRAAPGTRKVENQENQAAPGVRAPHDKQPAAVVRNRETQESELKQIGKYYRDFAAAGRPPAKAEDLADLKKQELKLWQKVKVGIYVLMWNADVNDAPAGAANTILGHEKEAPTRGGAVLMLDGSTKTMTAQEFQAAAKAGK